MTKTGKHKIAASFPGKYESHRLGIETSATEFEIFEDGIFAESMDGHSN